MSGFDKVRDAGLVQMRVLFNTAEESLKVIAEVLADFPEANADLATVEAALRTGRALAIDDEKEALAAHERFLAKFKDESDE
jgi:hypothetical protein